MNRRKKIHNVSRNFKIYLQLLPLFSSFLPSSLRSSLPAFLLSFLLSSLSPSLSAAFLSSFLLSLFFSFFPFNNEVINDLLYKSRYLCKDLRLMDPFSLGVSNEMGDFLTLNVFRTFSFCYNTYIKCIIMLIL